MKKTQTKTVTGAIVNLIEGMDGISQPKSVKGKLREIEKMGFAEFVKGKWYLTLAGREFKQLVIDSFADRR